MDIKFPHHMSLSIEHNQHKNYYEKLEDYLKNDGGLPRSKHLTSEEYKKCIETDELWEIQFYPISPISFHYIAAPTLYEALDKMKNYE